MPLTDIPRRRRWLLLGASAAALTVIAAVAVPLWWSQRVWTSVERVQVDLDKARRLLQDEPPPSESSPSSSPNRTQPEAENPTAFSEVPPPPMNTDAQAVLLVGSDARPGLGGARADVIMVVEVRPGENVVSVISLPRDLATDVPCFGYTRINAALNGCRSRGVNGLELLAVTVSNWTGVQIDHVAMVDFSGFAQVVDAVGGVKVCVPRPVRDLTKDLSLEAGCSILPGEEALKWVRSRHTQELTPTGWRLIPGVSDLARTDRQRDLVIQIFTRLSQLPFPRLVGLANELAKVVVLDSSWSPVDAVRLGWSVRDRKLVSGRPKVVGFTGKNGAALLRPLETYQEVRARLLTEG